MEGELEDKEYKSRSMASGGIRKRGMMCGYRRSTSTIENVLRRWWVVIGMSAMVGNRIFIRMRGQLFKVRGRMPATIS